jgi:hypothetical protein
LNADVLKVCATKISPTNISPNKGYGILIMNDLYFKTQIEQLPCFAAFAAN